MCSCLCVPGVLITCVVCLCVRRLYMTVMGVTQMRRNMLTRQIWPGLSLTLRHVPQCGT